MEIKNMTAHGIKVIDRATVRFEPAIRKYISDSPKVVFEIPSSGMLNAKFEEIPGIPIEGIPVKVKQLVSIDQKPLGDCIVSAFYYNAAQDKTRLYTVLDLVYTPDGKTILGCLAIGTIR